jgi:hypothetical protein
MTTEVRRLPLWKHCFDEMRKDGIEYGKVFGADFLENHLSETRDSMRFSLDISRIRNAMLEEGYYLSGEGHNGNAYEIVPAADNHKIMSRKLATAKKETRQAVTLGVNTPMDTLTESERTRHSQVLERAQIRLALTRNASKIRPILQKTAPNLLKSIQDSEKSA